MTELLDESRSASGSDASFTWVADEFLMEQGVTPWSEIPLWVPEYDSQDSRGFMFVDVSLAIGEGMKFRPLSETISDTLRWFQFRAFSYRDEGRPEPRERDRPARKMESYK